MCTLLDRLYVPHEDGIWDELWDRADLLVMELELPGSHVVQRHHFLVVDRWRDFLPRLLHAANKPR